MAQIDLLKKIADAGGLVTAKDVGVTAARMRELEADGLVERPKKESERVRKTGKKGRPSHLFKLTRKSRDRVARAAKSAQKSSAKSKSAKTETAQATA